jgi:hypothetical protein
MHFLDGGCTFWIVDELFGKWMKTVVSSEMDEKNSMLDNGPDGEARRSGQDGSRYPMGEQGRWTPGHPNGCPMEGRRVSDGGG